MSIDLKAEIDKALFLDVVYLNKNEIIDYMLLEEPEKLKQIVDFLIKDKTIKLT